MLKLMCRLALLFLAFEAAALAQISPGGFVVFVSVDPTGGCNAVYITQNVTTGVLSGCVNGTWQAIGGGSGTFTALTGDATSTATGGATTVIGVHGAVIPLSAVAVATNASRQLVAASVQGSGDTKVMLAGTVSGLAATLCTDANGGATTTGCSAGGGGNTTSTSLTTNTLPKANGANSIINSNETDDGTTFATTLPFQAPSMSTSGSGAGADGLGGGTQSLAIFTNQVGWMGPATTPSGNHFFAVPLVGAAANQFMLYGAESAVTNGFVSTPILTTFISTSLTDTANLLYTNASRTVGSGTTLTFASGAILDLHLATTAGLLFPGGLSTGVVRVTTSTGAVTSSEMSGDCTTTGSNALTCTKTSGTPFGTAATVNTGTSGATIGLLNGNLTFSGANAYGTPSSIVLTNASGFPTLNQNTTGNAATATNLATYPALCTGGQVSTGYTTGSPPTNNCVTPGGSGISLTTIGSSGAATLIGSVLNIPVYGGGSGTVTNVTGTSPIAVATGTTTPVVSLNANGVTSAFIAVVNTYRTCDIPVNDTSGSAITNAQLGPQSRVCFIPAASTIVEMDVNADAGTPNIIVGRNHAGTITNIVSGALATAASGGIACTNTGGTTGINGATTCSSTLQNTSLSAGDYLELVSGTAGGTAKFFVVHVIYTVN